MPWLGANGLLPGRGAPGRAPGRGPGVPPAGPAGLAAGLGASSAGTAEAAGSSATGATGATGSGADSTTGSAGFATARGPGLPAGRAGAFAAGFSAASGAADVEPAARSWSPYSFLKRIATGGSIVDDADLTNSPISFSFSRTNLLSTPNSLASSWTRGLATGFCDSFSARPAQGGPLDGVHAHREVLIECS